MIETTTVEAPVALDPKYGQKIGPFKCGVADCQGHRQKYHATVHRIAVAWHTKPDGTTTKEHRRYTLTEIEQAVKRLQDRGEVTSIKEIAKELHAPYGSLVIFIKRLGSQAERIGIAKHSRSQAVRANMKGKSNLPSNRHWHQGRRGACCCPNPEGPAPHKGDTL